MVDHDKKDIDRVSTHLQKAISDVNLLPTNDISFTYLKQEILYHLKIVLDYLEKENVGNGDSAIS